MEIHLLDQQILKNDRPPQSMDMVTKLGVLLHRVDENVQTVRRIATELRPPILDDLGLAAALESQTQQFQRLTGLSCVIAANIENIEVGSEFSTAVFRIFQETLTNITRHAEANTTTVILKNLEHKLILRIEDDGIGIQPENIIGSHSLGILGMRERARLVGGELEVFKGTENGTVVLLTAPLGLNRI